MSEDGPKHQKKKTKVLKIETGVINISPFGFQYFASEFLNTAKSYPTKDRFTPVPYYLYCRSLELSVKAFLLLKGKSKKFIKNKVGHDLLIGFKEAEKLNLGKLLQVKQSEKIELEKANEYYASKSFEYFDITKVMHGYPALPDLDILDSLAERLVENLYQPCKEA